MSENRNFRKVREGIVVSDKMDKTVVVKVEDARSMAFIQRSSQRVRNLRRTMNLTPPELAIAYALWRPNHSLQQSVGE